jgi:hypothetical protein
MLFLAWRYGREDPYRLYNGLDADYRPLGHPEEEPRPPRYPTRLRHFLYGAGLFGMDMDAKLASGAGAVKVAKAMGGGR